MRFHLEQEQTNRAVLQSVQIQSVVLNQSIKMKTENSRELVKVKRMKTRSGTSERLNRSLM